MKKFYAPEGEEMNVGNGGPSELDKSIVEAKFGEEAKKKIKDFRVRIDSFYLTAKMLQPSREISLAITAFQQARQFCGIMLGEKGALYPYSSMNIPGPVVGERNDKGEVIESVMNVENVPSDSSEEIERLRAFRGKVEDAITDFAVYLDVNTYSSIKDFVAQNKVLECLMSGKMWLGEQMVILSGIS